MPDQSVASYLCDMDTVVFTHQLAEYAPDLQLVCLQFRHNPGLDRCYKILRLAYGTPVVERLSRFDGWDVMKGSPFAEKLCGRVSELGNVAVATRSPWRIDI